MLKILDRAPMVDDIVTITPKGETLFEVVALDELYGELIYVQPLDPKDERSPFWHSLTHVKVVDDEDPRAWS